MRARRAWLAVALLALATTVALSLQPSPPAGARSQPTQGVDPQPSSYALHSIPASYLHFYLRAAGEYGLDWTKLAAVGQIESDHGRSAQAGVRNGTNSAGAAGPAQFLAHTWARYGVDADGSGKIDPYNPADAITAMAAYLKASGAPENWHAALFTYNHSESYVRTIMALSLRFSANPVGQH